jgi:amino acid adenylation domain-containing protein
MSRTSVQDTYELSPLQEGMLFHALAGAEPGVDVLHVTCELEEELDTDRFVDAWRIVVARHAAFRTSFRLQEDGSPLQDVYSEVDLPVAFRDWRGLPAGEQERDWCSLLEHDRERGFDLFRAPLLRLALARLGECQYRLLWSLHHAIIDGRAFPVVLEEVFACYDAARQGRALELPPAAQFGQYVGWLRQLDHGPAEAYWRNTLRGFSAPTPIGALPPSGEAGRSGHGAQQVRLSAALTERLNSLAGASGVSLGNLVQGAWLLLLHHYSRERDVVFGSTRTLRWAGPEGVERMVGVLINTLPVRMTVDPALPLGPWLRSLREAQRQPREYDLTPLARVQGCSEIRGGTPLFDSIVVFDRMTLDDTMRGWPGNWEGRRFDWVGQTNFAATLLGWGGSELLLRLEHYRRVLDDASAERMLRQLHHVLEAMPEDADRPIGRLPLLSTQERQTILVDWNRTEAEYPRGVPLARLVEEQVERTPDAVAVVFGNESVTYGELNVRANQLAHALIGHGVGPDRLVGICAERSVHMLVGLLAIVKAGAGYLPLDPLLPPERLGYMLEDSGATVVVTQESLRESLPAFSGTVVVLDDPRWKANGRDDPTVVVDPTDLAYVIYTSGSTGKPKGVEIPRGALANLLWSMRDWLQLGAEDRVLAVTTISFDIAGVDVWLPLLVGARVVLARREDAADGLRLSELVDEHGVTFLQATPVTWRLLLEAGWQGKEDLQIVCTGEAMPRDLAAELQPIVRRLWNLYGPTETTIWSTGYLVRDGTAPILIGRPVANTQAYVLDENLQPVAIGAVGELFLGGDGLARGYLGRPELTVEKFVSDPFRPGRGARLYRTGDLARFLPDGNLECLGRTDHQVKIRGYRIELGEIEAVLGTHSSVRHAVVTAREDRPGDKRLVAYVVAHAVPTTDALEAPLRELLATQLPEYMVPAAFVFLETMPLNANGKVDRRALPAPPEQSAREYVAPRDAMETKLSEIWASVLGKSRIGIEDNFFEAGGNSLSVMQVAGQARRQGLELETLTVFQYPTVRGLAEHLSGHAGAASRIDRVRERALRQREAQAQKKTLRRG